MKIEFTVTCTLTPESRGEMIDTFGKQYRELRESVETQMAVTGYVGIPAAHLKGGQVRWLLNSGRWDGPTAQ